MKAGFHTCDITPALGMEAPGGYGKAYIGKIHDPLKVRAAVLDDGRAAVALVGLDTCLFQTPAFCARIRQEVERICGIPGNHILLAASHTHSGGPLFGLLPDTYEDASDLVKDLIANHSTTADPVYCEWVIGQTITAICEAYRKRQEALLCVGSGHEDQVAFNRRFKMRNGRVYTHPGKGNPEILCPAGPIDPEVGVLAAWDAGGKLLGCVVNYACHATTFGGAVSADFIYYLERTIQGAMRPDAVVVFLNGASGDVTQVDNQSLREREFGEKWSRFVGTRIGAEAVKALVTAERGELTPITATAHTLPIQRRPPGAAHLAESRRIVEEGLRTAKYDTAWTFAKEILILEYLIQKQPVVGVEIQALQIGPAVFLANPSEYFCALGLAIKRASPFPFTYVVGLANGAVGYVPDEEAFLPSGGGYETVLTSYSNLEVTAGSKIRDASLDLACSLQPGPVPQMPQVDEPGQPWSYGILGPDLE